MHTSETHETHSHTYRQTDTSHTCTHEHRHTHTHVHTHTCTHTHMYTHTHVRTGILDRRLTAAQIRCLACILKLYFRFKLLIIKGLRGLGLSGEPGHVRAYLLFNFGCQGFGLYTSGHYRAFEYFTAWAWGFCEASTQSWKLLLPSTLKP